MESFHHPGIAPALFLSQISRGSVEGLDVFPDLQASLQITECPHQKTPPCPCPTNENDDMCPPSIVMSYIRGIEHLLKVFFLCSIFLVPQNLLTCLVIQRQNCWEESSIIISTASQFTKSKVVIFILPF